MEIETKIVNISIPCEYTIEGEYHLLHLTKEYEDISTGFCISQGKSFEEAEKDLISMIKMINKYHLNRANYLKKYEWFSKGDWNHTGGSWFTILGIHVYFRYGKGMQGGGWYIPFTKMNVSITNYWRQKWSKKEK